MYRVLLPVDDSVERAQRQATYVASLPCAAEQIFVLVAHGPMDNAAASDSAPEQLGGVESVDRAIAVFEGAGIEYETGLLDTPPADGILQTAAAESVDEIVMGGRKRTPAEKAILGSVSQNVMLNTDVPVVITGGEGNSRDV